jgi:hypothetical protein
VKRQLLFTFGVGLALGLTALAWAALDLPGRPWVRGHLGDVGAVMVLVAAIGLALPRLGARAWIALAAAIAAATEVAQALGVRGEGLAGELTIGATFDPLDLLAYGAGLALASWMIGGAPPRPLTSSGRSP